MIAAAKGMSWESPRGPIMIDPETRDIVQTVYIRRVEKTRHELRNVEFDRCRTSRIRSTRRSDPERVTPDTTRSPVGCQAMPPVFGVLFDGLAYGMLLFLMSVGLSVTLGMMNFVNLAHCSFAMLGGYVTVTLMNAWGWPFFATLPVAFIAAASASVVLERLFFRRFYNACELSQCLLTIGIVFVSIAGAAYIYGTDQQSVQMPPICSARSTFWGSISPSIGCF